MSNTDSVLQRKVFGRTSIAVGNAVQAAGIVAAAILLASARFTPTSANAAIKTAGAWVLLYFFSHGIAHWGVGRLVGIRFAFYTIGGTANPKGYPGPLRWIFERLPFFGVQTDKASMQAAGPVAKAIMWSAGVTSSALTPTLGAIWAWQSNVAGSKAFLIFAVVWALATVASNWTSRTGDYAKARRALGRA